MVAVVVLNNLAALHLVVVGMVSVLDRATAMAVHRSRQRGLPICLIARGVWAQVAAQRVACGWSSC